METLLEGRGKDKLVGRERLGRGTAPSTEGQAGGRGRPRKECEGVKEGAVTSNTWRGQRGPGGGHKARQMDTHHLLSEKLRSGKTARVRVKLCRFL